MTKTINFGGKMPMKILSFKEEDYGNTWEKEYVQELISTLKKGMVVYDIGAENGELSVMAANIVGGENVHIFEANKDYFPNIKAIWDANNLADPSSCFNGYVDEVSSKWIVFHTLKELSKGEIFYGCYHANPKVTPMQTVSLDKYSKSIWFKPPDVIMMDIEGAELSAVKGAKEIIEKYAPIFFISIHPQYIQERSNGTKEELLQIFLDNNYTGVHLSTDHEEHWKFTKNKSMNKLTWAFAVEGETNSATIRTHSISLKVEVGDTITISSTGEKGVVVSADDESFTLDKTLYSANFDRLRQGEVIIVE